MKRLLRVTVAMGGFSLVNLVTGFMRVKYGAIALGPQGIGLLAQANGFLLLAINICGLNLGTAIVKRLSEALDAGDHHQAEALLDTTFQLLCVTGLGAVALLALSIVPVTRLLLGEMQLALPLLSVVLAVPLSILAAGFYDPIMFGADRYDLYTRASVAGALFGLASFLLMTSLWGVPGAMCSIGIAALLRLAAFMYYGAQAVAWRPRLTWHLSTSVLRSLVGYGAAMLVVAALLEGTNLSIRTVIVRTLGPAANGVYQVPVALSAYYSVFFTNGLWGHLYPKVSRQLSQQERRYELNAALRFITLGVTVMAAALSIVRKPLVTLLYSYQFSNAESLIPWYLAGDLFFLLSMVYMVSLLALPRLKTYVAIWGGFCLLRFMLSWVLLGSWGLVGPAVAYGLSAAALLLACMIYHAIRLSLPVSTQNVCLAVSAAAVILYPLFLPLPANSRLVVQGLLTLLWLLLVVTEEERAFAISSLGRWLPPQFRPRVGRAVPTEFEVK